MQTNKEIRNLQQNLVRKHAQESSAHQFFNLLTGSQFFSAIEDLLPEHRERRFPPTETLSLFLSQAMSADRSCQNIVNELAIQRVANGLPASSTYTGSYCKARQRLPTTMVSTLARHAGTIMDDGVPVQWCWQGRSVRLIDGTTVTLPDTPENQVKYPQQSSQKPGLGFPICRIVGVICLASGGILNAEIGLLKGKAQVSKHCFEACLIRLRPAILY